MFVQRWFQVFARIAPIAILSSVATAYAASTHEWGKHVVGHGVMSLSLTDSDGKPRPLDILLWYPADRNSYNNDATPSSYTQRLNGVTLDPDKWDPLSWEIASEAARDNAALKHHGRPFPLIVFSAGAGAQPENHAGAAERLASHGFIVAAPFHNGDTEDDANIDYVNALAGTTIVPCLDGLPAPCIDPVRKSVRDRKLDVTAIIDNIATYFGDQVDLTRIGLVGHSRGSVLGLAVAGGSTAWNITPEPRVGAIVMMSNGFRPVAFAQNVASVTIPMLQISGDRDVVPAVSAEVFAVAPSAVKALVVLKGATHRPWGDRRCVQTQAMGAIAQSNPRAVLETRSVNSLLTSVDSGTSLDYCSYDTFTNPVDITPYVLARTGILVTEDNVPGLLDAHTMMVATVKLTVSFLNDTLRIHEDEDNAIGTSFGSYLGIGFEHEFGAQIDSMAAYPCLGSACGDVD